MLPGLRFSTQFLGMAALLVGMAATGSAQSKPYPRPQTASAAGQKAPDFTLKDQNGESFTLSGQGGRWVLLYLYRGYWCPYCMTEMRELAKRSSEFEKLGVQVVPISVDDQQHAREVWEKAAARKFNILSDPGAKVLKSYGLLHQAGHDGSDIALRTTLLIGPDGRERWRRVSQSVPDIPTAEETLDHIRLSQSQRLPTE